jgi:polyhydroxybutyrate depolymerase
MSRQKTNGLNPVQGSLNRRDFLAGSIAAVGVGVVGLNPRAALSIKPKELEKKMPINNDPIERRLDHDGMERRYLLTIPPKHEIEKPAPLILFFHGGGGTADRLAAIMDFYKFPDGQDYVIAYPDGFRGSFNAGPGPDGKSPNWGAAFEAKLDDVGFASAIIDDAASYVSVDLHRVYAAGWSNGSAMSFRLACELTDRIAAVAGCFSELSLVDPKLSRPIPMLYCWGTDDPVRRPGSLPKDEMAARCIRTLRTLNKCHPEPVRIEQRGHATMTRWEGDHADAVVIQWRLEGHGHLWPGLEVPQARREAVERAFGPISSDISATREALNLFANHRIPDFGS